VAVVAHRDRALLSEYSEIVDEHGLAKAVKFVTPRELRTKLLRQAHDKGLLSCLKASASLAPRRVSHPRQCKHLC
jgi:hypothetical protein